MTEHEALKCACDRLQSFLDTFGDLGDCETQADLNDWREAAPTSTERHCEFCHIPMASADCCDSEFESKGCPHMAPTSTEYGEGK